MEEVLDNKKVEPSENSKGIKNHEHKMTATEFLKKHKIWFDTVLSFALTCAAVMVSIASYNVTKYQTELDEQSIISLDLEKQPYFSIENNYIEEDNEYTYVVRNTGGEIRYINVYLFPYLYVEREKEGQYQPLDYAFIELPSLYRNSEVQLDDNTIFAFRDYMFFDNESGTNILANDLFNHYSCSDNLSGMNTRMNSQIIYRLQVSYVNYKNEYKVDVITFSRSSDVSDKTKGNTILSVDMSDRFLLNNSKKIYSVDSLNLISEDIRKQCEEIISNLRLEFGQTKAAEKYRESSYR